MPEQEFPRREVYDFGDGIAFVTNWDANGNAIGAVLQPDKTAAFKEFLWRVPFDTGGQVVFTMVLN